MSNESKREYLKTIKEEYRKSSRREKTVILMHAMLVTGLSRKRIIRVLNGKDLLYQPRKRGRTPRYGVDVIVHLKRLWFLMEQPCGKKLKVLIPRLLPSYRKRTKGLAPELEAKLVAMSAATIDRFLREIRTQRGLSTTRPPTSSWYKTAIPVQAKDWNIIGIRVYELRRGQFFTSTRPKPIEVLRSRPYRKNDNCYVEQKNLTHVRQFIGYDRIESEAATQILDDLYKNYWCPFLNFFMPTFKLLRKERIGSRIKKKHDIPKTPYERLLESPAISEERKAQLRQIYQSLDPFALKLKIEEKLKAFYDTIRTDSKATGIINQAA